MPTCLQLRVGDAAESGVWYLVRATTFLPATPVYETLPATFLGLADVDTLEKRMGHRHWLVQGERWDVSVT